MGEVINLAEFASRKAAEQPTGVIDPFVAADVAPDGISTVAENSHVTTMSVLLKLVNGAVEYPSFNKQ